jgi:hypothetical protein
MHKRAKVVMAMDSIYRSVGYSHDSKKGEFYCIFEAKQNLSARLKTHLFGDEGIDWVMLTNGMSIELHRIIFSKPVSDVQIFKFDLSDLSQIEKASDALVNITKRAVEKGELEEYWKRFDALSPVKLVKTIYTADIISAIRRKVKKDSGMNFNESDVLEAVHQLIVCDNKDAVKPKKLK